LLAACPRIALRTVRIALVRHQRTEESAERTARRLIGSGAVGNGGSKGSPSMRLIFAENDLGDSIAIAAMETKSQEGIERLVRTERPASGAAFVRSREDLRAHARRSKQAGRSCLRYRSGWH
jgi:hypothetical protein